MVEPLEGNSGKSVVLRWRSGGFDMRLRPSLGIGELGGAGRGEG